MQTFRELAGCIFGGDLAGVRLRGGGGLSALYQSLVAYWKLDEASGNRADSAGANTLTDNNTVTSNTGLVYATAAEFTAANSEYLSIADNAELSMGNTSFSLLFWVRFATLPSLGSAMALGGKLKSSNNEYCAYVENELSTTRFKWLAQKADNSGFVIAVATTFGALSANTWYMVRTQYDLTNGLLGISVNNGALDTEALVGGVRDGTADFDLGRYNTVSYINGRMGPVGVWKRLLTADEWTALYGGGAGYAIPF